MPDAPAADAVEGMTVSGAAQEEDAAQTLGERRRRSAKPSAQREHGDPLDEEDEPAAGPLQATSDDFDYGSSLLPQDSSRGEAALVATRLEGARISDPPAEALTDEKLAALRAEAEATFAEWRAAASVNAPGAALAAAQLWARFEALTAPLAGELCEQLRLILEPQLAARMQGDYATGKRLNMRKIIPYLASDFRRDKIWLRRSKPSVRKYQARSPFSDRWLGFTSMVTKPLCQSQFCF